MSDIYGSDGKKVNFEVNVDGVTCRSTEDLDRAFKEIQGDGEKAVPENPVKLSNCLRLAEEIVDDLQEAGCDAFEARDVLLLAWQSQESRIERVIGTISQDARVFRDRVADIPERSERQATRRRDFMKGLRDALEVEDQFEERITDAVKASVAGASDQPLTGDVAGGTE
ncbi:hypothetical protein [Pseudovibrio sp. POLY-S9]|uniref:hypothetical protein n=1 Tax=Pseudovibrio sp. POLY-S9 TaxID=1576596 RepID=UPI0007097E87|nr:hypothetical protein [Pseudovibrio sp. POLY-S9]